MNLANAPGPPALRSAPTAAALAFVLTLACLGVAFLDSFRAVVSVWNSESFAHGWIVPPITAWLVWRRRTDLRACSIVPYWPAVAGLIACGAGWLVGRLAGVNTVEQIAIVGMLQCVVLLLFGAQIYQTIAFPMLFLFFAVPFGQFLQPPLMEMTANFTVEAVRLTGVPIVREGLHFELPTGRWSVVEACSGLRYLLAAMPIACIYAYLSYRSMTVRALFVATVILVAILANWLRAYMIVMLGHLSGMTVAVGVDHIIYGWVFFGMIMALSFWVGSFWEDPPEHALPHRSVSSAQPASQSGPLDSARSPVGFGFAGLAAAASVMLWPLLATTLFGMGRPSVSVTAMAAVATPAPIPTDNDVYHPMYEGGVERFFGRSIADPEVGVYVVHYVHQHRSGEMLTWGNRIVPAGPEDLTWRIVDRVDATPSRLGGRFPGADVNEYVVQGPSGRFIVWEWFWVNGRELVEPRSIKLLTALDLLRGRGDESLAWFVWTRLDGERDSARKKLARAADSLQPGARLARLH